MQHLHLMVKNFQKTASYKTFADVELFTLQCCVSLIKLLSLAANTDDCALIYGSCIVSLWKKKLFIHTFWSQKSYNSFESRNGVIMTMNYVCYPAFVVISQCPIIVHVLLMIDMRCLWLQFVTLFATFAVIILAIILSPRRLLAHEIENFAKRVIFIFF